MEIFDEGKPPLMGASQDENFSGVTPGKIPLTRRFFSGASENKNIGDKSPRLDRWTNFTRENHH